MKVVPVVVFLAIGSFIGLVVWLARRQSQKLREQVHAFAQQRGLRVSERTTLGVTTIEALEGEQSGRVIRYWTYTTGSGKSRVYWMAAGVRPKQHGGLEFKLSRQGIGSKISEWFGVKEIKVGDPQFDAAWFIESNQPDFFAAALVPEIRAKLAADPKQSPSGSYRLKDGIVLYAQRGQFSNTTVIEMLERQLPVLHDLADVAEVFAGSQA